jgi:PTH1 family peptidyl-tRNA hydrolase
MQLRRPSRSRTSVAYIFVGLGNPDAEYAGTRHNAGADAVSEVARRFNLSPKLEKGVAASLTTAQLGSERVVLAIPTTYMNESGIAVRDLLARYEVEDHSRIVIVHDELDLEPGETRIKLGGGLAGHNGLRSTAKVLNSQDFTRVRIGVGKPRRKEQGADHVLSKPRGAELETYLAGVQAGANAIEAIAASGVAAAMNATN